MTRRSIHHHLQNDPANRKLKTAVHHLLRDLHGPDVYWNGSANLEDGNRSTCFGTVFVSAFPLAAMFTPDDPEVDKTARFSLRMDVGVWNGHGVDDEHGIQLSTEEERQRIIDLVTLNADEEIVRRKRIRLMLRALENLPVQYLYECEKNKTIVCTNLLRNVYRHWGVPLMMDVGFLDNECRDFRVESWW